MKVNKRKQIKVFLIALISILTISIGYASISAINMLINGNGTASVNQNNFKVHFTEAKEITGTTGVDGTSIIESDDTVASFNVTGLSKTGDYAEAKYTVKNDSAGIGASIGLQVTNSNSEYFIITETIDDNKLQAGEETLATVKVEMIKTPITDSVTTNITAQLIATPLEDESATGGSPASRASDDPVSFATDSWATIKTAVHNNNTSLYHVGDTKTVTIGANNYTVRIANKSTAANCGNSDYSETACGFVVEFAEIVEKRAMNSAGTNVGGWPGSELHTYLEGDFYNSLPSDLKVVIEPTRVISGYGNNGTDSANFVSENQKLYLLSGVEVFGADSNDTAASTTSQLDYYIGMTSETGDCDWYPGCTTTYYNRAIKQYNDTNTYWWLRPARSLNRNDFRGIRYVGYLSYASANNTYGVSPAFRIA